MFLKKENRKKAESSPPIKDEDNIAELRKFQDTFETHYRALKVDEELYSTAVVPLILEKLPKELHLTIIRRSKFLEWIVKELLTALTKELNIRDEIRKSASKGSKDVGKKYTQ